MGDTNNKIVKLNIAPDFNFYIIAIATCKDDYSICWEINHALGLELKNTQDYELTDGNLTKKYSKYVYDSEVDRTNYVLINNDSENGKMIKDLAQFNFFLKITTEYADLDVQNIIDKIKNINNVILVSNVSYTILSEKKKKMIFGIFTEF